MPKVFRSITWRAILRSAHPVNAAGSWTCCARLNNASAREHESEAALSARIETFELAYRMQMAALKRST